MTIGASSGSPILLFIILAFGVIYLLFVRPQRRRQSQQQQMVNELRVGDEVLTAGGIYGTISELDDDQVTVEIAPETEVRVARRAIAGVTREPEEDAEAAEPEETAGHEEPTEPDEAAEPEDEDSSDSGGGDTSNEESRG
jgi:preprotein translocase subunit YajC